MFFTSAEVDVRGWLPGVADLWPLFVQKNVIFLQVQRRMWEDLAAFCWQPVTSVGTRNIIFLAVQRRMWEDMAALCYRPVTSVGIKDLWIFYLFTNAEEDVIVDSDVFLPVQRRMWEVGCLVWLTSDLCWYKIMIYFDQCRGGCERMAALCGWPLTSVVIMDLWIFTCSEKDVRGWLTLCCRDLWNMFGFGLFCFYQCIEGYHSMSVLGCGWPLTSPGIK